MGHKFSREKRKISKIFLSPQNSTVLISITNPSTCTSPSFHLSVKQSTSTASSDVFNWSQMQRLYLQQEVLTADHISLPILKVTSTILELLKRQINEICADLYFGSLKLPDGVLDKFENLTRKKSQTQAVSAEAIKKIVVHFVRMLYVHDLIIDYFKEHKTDQALDLIKQLTVSHALGDITPTEFRMMDWFIIHYLIKNKVTSDESINYLIIYLNTVSNYVTKYYVTQSVRHEMIENITAAKENDRKNKARENFRLMRRWKQQIESLKEHKKHAVDLLEEQIKLHPVKEEIQSIDTATLKENDFIMKHFVKKKCDFTKNEHYSKSMSS